MKPTSEALAIVPHIDPVIKLNLADGFWESMAELNPEELLESHLHEAPIKFIRRAAYQAPHIAYEVAVAENPKISGQMKAVLLSYTVDVANVCFDDAQLESYNNMIIHSVTYHHETWLETFGGDWMSVFHELQIFLGIDLGLTFDNSFPSRSKYPE